VTVPTCYALSMRRALARTVLFATSALALLGAGAAAPSALARPGDARWLASTPDAMIERAARASTLAPEDALARVLFIASLAPEATAGRARAALEALGNGHGAAAEQARWLARALAPESATSDRDETALAVAGDTELGVVRALAVLGPFEDTGGGLAKREGVERDAFDFRTADASWGAVTVKPTRSLVATVTARGIPLDLYVHPRRESCTYLASAITVPSSRTLVVNVAASGSFRLLWDGRDAAASSESHRRALVDRVAVEVAASAGEHVLAVKVCNGAQADDGRVRLRFAAPDGSPVELASSSAPEQLQRALEDARQRPADVVTPRATVFQRASALPENPSITESMRAAIVRILAGADDLQSPRAPGMLGLVAANSSIDAETLAIAGYLAPFGANRSGWLRRAYDRARAANETDTLAFAQRALILAQVGSLQHDLALATAAEEPFASAKDSQAELIRAEIFARLGSQGLRLKAIALLQEVARKESSSTPEALWRALGQFTQGSRPTVHLAAMQKLVAMAPGYQGAASVSAYRLFGVAEVEAAARRARGNVDDARVLDRIAHSLLELGRPASALRLFELSASLSPNRASAHVGIAQSLEAAGTAGAGAVRKALARAHDLEPGDAALSAELGYRADKRAASPDLGPDTAFLVPPKEFLDRVKERPAPKEGLFERQVHWRRVVRLHPDKRISQTIHYAREILIEPRTENDRYERVPEASPTSELLIARVHRPDGTILEPEEKEATGSMLRWPALRRGDVVEIAVRAFTPGPVGRRGDAPFYFVDYVGAVATHPVLYNEVVIDAPRGSALAFDVLGGKPDRRLESVVGDRTITQLIWDSPPTIADEPLAPPPSETMPVVVGSIYPSWKEFLGWYRGAIEGFTEPDEQIKQVAAEVTAGKTTRDEKLEALFNYVADDIRYVNYASGEWWLPNRPQHLLARRQGDCDDKANLLISLLRAVGIDATEVLIQTRHTGQPRLLFESKIAVPMFDHGIVFLPDGKGGGRFLDATSPQSRLGAPPAMDARAAAVLVTDGDVGAIATPSSSPDEHGVDSTLAVTLDREGNASVVASEKHVGDSAFFLRTHLGQADARAQWVEANLVARNLPNAKLAPEVGFDGSLPGGAAKVAYQATSRALARREGEDLVLSFAPPSPLATELAPLATRTLPVVLPPQLAPSHHDVTIVVTIPDGFRLAAVPPNDELVAGNLGAVRQRFELSKDGKKLTIARSLRFDASRIEVNDYARWRSWLREADRIRSRTLRLIPTKR
jgi:tetratricopeptide (TPR) repeat protein